jgi:predicted SAM-dependent methyltransferase
VNFSRSKISLKRPITSYSKIQAFIGLIARNRRSFANIREPGCYVDIGCGPNIDPSFCNVDYCWRPDIDVCWDANKALPFPDGYVGGIFTEHMIEHIPFESALFLLKECRRILRKDAIMRIVMPDGALYFNEYARGDEAKIPYAHEDMKKYPFVTPMVSVNRIFREHGHRFIWDFPTLRQALTRAGFENVDACAFGQGKDKRLLRDTASRKVESFYAEAY